MKLIAGYVAGHVLCIGILAGVYAVEPDIRYLFTVEDSMVETLSAVMFLVSFLVASWLLVTRRTAHRMLLALIAVLGAVGFLDELSFGERMFDLSMPVVAGKKVDAVHDVVGILRNVVASVDGFSRWFAAGLAVSVILAAFGYALAWLARREPNDLVPYVAMGIFGLTIGGALLLDTHVIRFQGATVTEEVLELSSACTLVFACWCVPRSWRAPEAL